MVDGRVRGFDAQREGTHFEPWLSGAISSVVGGEQNQSIRLIRGLCSPGKRGSCHSDCCSPSVLPQLEMEKALQDHQFDGERARSPQRFRGFIGPQSRQPR
jgi:hypothetical protein